MKLKPEKKHAKFSASGAARWLKCPASIPLSEKAPPQKDSPWAKDGTEAHECFELIHAAYLKTPNKFPEKDIQKIRTKYGEEKFNHARDAVFVVHEEARDFSGVKEFEVEIEQKVKLDHIHPEMFGTADVIAKAGDALLVFDYKYGVHKVNPENNPQLMFYLLGAYRNDVFSDFNKFKSVIIQPRVSDREITKEYVFSSEVNKKDLLKWDNIFKRGVEAALKKNPEFNPDSETCRYCPAKTICPAISEKALTRAQAVFLNESKDKNILKLPTPEALLKRGKIKEALDAFPLIETWMESVRYFATETLHSGKEIEGYSLDPKRAITRWAEDIELDLESEFGDDGFEYAPKSPSEIEKEFGKRGKAFVKKNTVKVSSGLKLTKREGNKNGK